VILRKALKPVSSSSGIGTEQDTEIEIYNYKISQTAVSEKAFNFKI
jgi:hypothetical protein